MIENEAPKLGAVLLAAGGSYRLGRPKQLLKINGETLLRRAARSLAGSVYSPVVVVIGNKAEEMSTELAELPVHTVANNEWAQGMGASIRKGLEKLLDLDPDIAGVIFTLCDQPRVTTEHLERFAQAFARTRAPVIAAAYDRTAGVPALFSISMFDELLKLDGDRGARQIIRGRADTLSLDLPEASVDIDIEADLVRFGITNSE